MRVNCKFSHTSNTSGGQSGYGTDTGASLEELTKSVSLLVSRKAQKAREKDAEAADKRRFETWIRDFRPATNPESLLPGQRFASSSRESVEPSNE